MIEFQAFCIILFLAFVFALQRYGPPRPAYHEAVIADLDRLAALPLPRRTAFYLCLGLGGYWLWNSLFCTLCLLGCS